MNSVIIRFAYRECAFFVAAILLLQFVFVLFYREPLRYFDSALCLLNLGLGFCLGKRIFSDDGGVRAFLFSRSFNPTRLFLVRWMFGFGVILTTLVVHALLISLGARQAVQQSVFQSGWYPMVRYSELEVLWTVAITALFTYHTTIFFVIRNRMSTKPKLGKTARWTQGVMNLILIVYAIGIVMTAIILAGADLFLHPGFETIVFPALLFIFGLPTLAQLLLTPWFGVYCYNRMEVES